MRKNRPAWYYDMPWHYRLDFWLCRWHRAWRQLHWRDRALALAGCAITIPSLAVIAYMFWRVVIEGKTGIWG